MRLLLLNICFALLVVTSAFSQEGKYPLRYNQALTQEKQNQVEISAQRSVFKGRFIYEIDTLSLPFFDDFSQNKIKAYDAQIGDANVSLKINHDFSVNGEFPVEFEYMNETSYSITKLQSGDTVQSPNPQLHIVFFEDGIPVGYDTGWTNVITKFDASSGLVSHDTLVADEYLTNTPDTFYLVADNNTLWTPPIDSFDSIYSVPWVNNSFGENLWTQGVATFDGTDANGFPYDISSETSYGRADMFESKPLNIDSFMSNVYLSFVYQAGGLGNLPELEDSLVVEFFNVEDETWEFAWKNTEVEDSAVFTSVFLPVLGSKYQRPGFRFRFKNYSTLSGSFDHWHIDYVQLDKNRDTIIDDSLIYDVAFTKGIETFLVDYTSAPYAHYLASPTAFETDEVEVEIMNLGPDAQSLTGLRYEVFDKDDNLIFSEVTADPSIDGLTRKTTIFPITDSELFPDLDEECVDFRIDCFYTATGVGNAHLINDTITTTQRFWNYYSYDDGTAEQAYALTGAGLELAYGFDAKLEDTLKAFLVNFPQTRHNLNDDSPIKLMVWDNLDEDPIYEAEYVQYAQYTNANEFLRLELESPLVVSDSFFIGYRQIEATKVYIGLDVSRDYSTRLNYRIGEQWYRSSIAGALMMRPDFGDEKIINSTPEIVPEQVSVYPNPAHSFVTISGEQTEYVVRVVDITGRICKELYTTDNRIDLSNLHFGTYLLYLTDKSGIQRSPIKVLVH